jgi:hypothetical protein
VIRLGVVLFDPCVDPIHVKKVKSPSLQKPKTGAPLTSRSFKARATRQLQVKGEPITEGVAVTGQGVFETLREVAKLVLAELKKGG